MNRRLTIIASVALPVMLAFLVLSTARCLAAEDDYIGTWKASDKDGTYTLVINEGGKGKLTHLATNKGFDITWVVGDEGIEISCKEATYPLKGKILDDGTLRLWDKKSPMDFKKEE